VTRRFFHVELARELLTPESQIASSNELDRGVLERLGLLATLMLAADLVGASPRLADMTMEYAMVRTAFGRPIGSYQAIKRKCADMLVAVEKAAAAMVWGAAHLAADTNGVAPVLNAAKAFIDDAARRVVGAAQQIHGGIGFTREHDVHLYLRRIRTNAAMGATPDGTGSGSPTEFWDNSWDQNLL
jgi:alkylation response protein AidB-like acyl-CoA dehydrogenase